MTIEDLLKLKETENKIEFKEAKGGNFAYNGGSRVDPKERRRCILGYVVAFANEGGGAMAFGITDAHPHTVVGTVQNQGNIGLLEQNIYRDLGIRVKVEELYDFSNKRVLIILIPSRPFNKVYKFEGIPLCKVGDELREMSDQQLLSILNEQELDFSETICKEISIFDLDDRAIDIMRDLYARKQMNTQFLTLSKIQLLSDLELIRGDNLTFAALILLGKEEAIKRILPQCEVRLEYRHNKSNISFDDRLIVSKPYYLLIDEIWNKIDARNGVTQIQEQSYIFDIPFFNQAVIREAINNAISHRDYRRKSEIIIKQSSTEFRIISPGPFPFGVTLENLMTVNSTPRNRLLSNVLAKTGSVERSGQGIDKMFYQCISEAKPVPDYSHSDDNQVDVIISAVIEDKAFSLFIKSYQQELDDSEKLSLQEIVLLEQIRKRKSIEENNKSDIDKLLIKGLVEKFKVRNRNQYRLSKAYYSFVDQEAIYSKEIPLDDFQNEMILVSHISRFDFSKMNDFVTLFQDRMTREQVKNFVYNMVKKGTLETRGEGKGTKYYIAKSTRENAKLIMRALEIGLQSMVKNGELPQDFFKHK